MLLFSPIKSLVRGLFQHEKPKWITIMPTMGEGQNACLQTLKGHSSQVRSVAFSYDLAQLALASDDNIVKIQDVSSGEYLQTLEVSKVLFYISFNIFNLYLYTEIGAIDISALLGLRILLTNLKPYNPQYKGLALSINSIQITYNSKNLVWLPSEY